MDVFRQSGSELRGNGRILKIDFSRWISQHFRSGFDVFDHNAADADICALADGDMRGNSHVATYECLAADSHVAHDVATG